MLNTYNSNWAKIFNVLNKTERLIIGLMSGTSLDGLDIALCKVRGSGIDTQLELLQFITSAYSNHFKNQIKEIFANRKADLQQVCLMNEKIALCHSDMILSALKHWGLSAGDIDIIASHGQTIYHAPKSLHGLEWFPNATLQIGDGDHIAVKTGIITISDFRQKHIAAGGEGAPLAVYGDYLLFANEYEDRIMLNIGGIANFTYLPAKRQSNGMFSTDVGPGNTMMDQFVQLNYPGLHFDEDGTMASKGEINEPLLNALLDHQFLSHGFPKTTGPELFNMAFLKGAQRVSDTTGLCAQDVLATLNRFTGCTIVNGIKDCLKDGVKTTVYLSGGGMHNSLLVRFLKESLPQISFQTTASLGVNPDAKEAVLFAVLANETLVGDGISIGNDKDVPPVNLGKISFPR
jgi:anhydro-N-acetylmuramic acid kinase